MQGKGDHSKQARLFWGNQEPELIKQNVSGEFRTRKMSKNRAEESFFNKQGSVKLDMPAKGQREMLRNGLSGKETSQTSRKAKSHKTH